MNNDDQKIVWKKGTSVDATQSTPASSDTQTDTSTTDAVSADALVWKKSTKKKDISVDSSTEHISTSADIDTTVTSFKDTDMVDMAIRGGDQRSQGKTPNSEVSAEIDDVRADIEKMLSGGKDIQAAEVPKSQPLSKSDTSNTMAATAAATTSTPTQAPAFNIKDEIDQILKKQKAETVENVKSTSAIPVESSSDQIDNIEALKASINAELGSTAQPASLDTENTPSTSSKGVEQTYYGDVSGAMGSNKPATMAELLRKARFEKKEKAILSPTSKRNLLFIISGIILLGLAIFLLARVFQPEKKVEYITEKRVDSLVFSNLDTGINITDIGTEKTKQAIRTVAETELDEGSINQIYYVGEDQDKNLRRLNIRQVFDATEHTPPQLVYENVESDFMHGVYKTDENHPFMILKSLSYDKVFEGMKEWEPTMIDDLATYLDLPPEATDRSLIQDGFSDDIINNKNVRVARFIPRDADRSLLERIGDRIIETSRDLFNRAHAQTGYKVWGIVRDASTSVPLVGADVYVRDLGISTETNATGRYTLDISIDGVHQIEYRYDGYNIKNFDVDGEYNLNVGLQRFTPSDPGEANSGGNNFDGYVCYKSTKRCLDGNGNPISSDFSWRSDVNCYDELHNGVNDQQFDGSFSGQDGYSCFRVTGTKDYLQGDEFLVTLNTDDICFHSITGDRLNTTDQSRPDYFSPSHPLAICFQSYECHRFACRDRFNNEVDLSEQGKFGITCGETLESVPSDYEGRKVCREYTDLRLLNNISQSKLCFDENGTFIQTGTDGDLGASPGNDVNCITPTNRNQRLCLDANKQVVVPKFGVPLPGQLGSPYKICFEPLESASQGGLGDQFVTLNSQLRETAAALGRRFELLAATAKITNMSPEYVESLEDSSDFFYSVAYMDVLENETIEKGLTIVKILEDILLILDPTGTLSQPGPDGSLNLFGGISFAIEVIKDLFGFSHNVAWATVGIKLPKGEELYAGETVEGVEAIQQALVLVGLMEPLSVTGTLDLVTQEALIDLQDINDIETTGIVDLETLDLITGMVDGYIELYGGETMATIDDYFTELDPLDVADELAGEGLLGIGAHNTDVQSLQIILYSMGYDIEAINGIFDPQTCEALMQYQEFNDLVLADPDGGCTVSIETIESLNILIREGNYLGSGYVVGPDGFLTGVGVLSGTSGPGVISFATDAEASSLREGDVVLMYTFLDEQTILITRHESVITEIIKRRALDDIFNAS